MINISITGVLATRRAMWTGLVGLAMLVGLLAGARVMPRVDLGSGAPRAGAAALSSGRDGWAALAPTARLAISRALAHENPVGALAIASPSAPTPGALAWRLQRGRMLVSVGSVGALHLGLSALGRSGSLRAVAGVAAAVAGNRISYAHGGVEEWFAHAPVGLEQGFILRTRPAGHGELSLVAATVPNGARAILADDGQSVNVSDGAGRPLARYTGLRVTDATGRALAARMLLIGRRVVLRVADLGARYPLRIDPFVQVASLNRSGTASISVSSNGHTVAVGNDSAGYNPNCGCGAGEVYVFTEPSGGWKNAKPVTILKPPVGDTEGSVGTSVAISGDGKTIVAGAPTNGDGQGVAFVYTEPKKGWKHATGHQQDVLIPENDKTGGSGYGGFGTSVAISGGGHEIVVGEPSWNSYFGAVYEFNERSAGWVGDDIADATTVNDAGNSVEYCNIWCDTDTTGGSFGTSVAISSNGAIVAVGAPETCLARTGEQTGAIYVFAQNGGQLTSVFSGYGVPNAAETSCQGSDSDVGVPPVYGLGTSIAITSNGDTLAAGNPQYGVVQIFEAGSSGWANANAFTPMYPPSSPSEQSSAVGSSVAISGSGGRVVEGDPGANSNSGLAAVFTRPKHGWLHWPNNPPASDDSFLFEQAGHSQNDAYTGQGVAISSDGNTLFQTDGKYVDVFSQRTRAPSSTKLSCSPRPSTVFSGGAPWPAAANRTFTCTATVTGTHQIDTGVPQGKVAITSDYPMQGVFSHSSCTLQQSGHASADTAACNVKFTPSVALTFALTASYEGDKQRDPSQGTTTLAIPYGKATTTQISCAPHQVYSQVASTCTATDPAGGSGLPAILFTSKLSQPIGTSPLKPSKLTDEHCMVNQGGQTCTIQFTGSTYAFYDVTAEFPGLDFDDPSHASTKVTVLPPPTTTTTKMNCSPTTATTGEQIACTAVVMPVPPTSPSITFSSSPTTGSFGTPSCAPGTHGSNMLYCVVAFTATAAGPYTLTGTYPGDPYTKESAGSATVSVLDQTGTSVSCAQKERFIDCLATVTDTSATPTVPTGTATFALNPSATLSAGSSCSLTASGGSAASCQIQFSPANATTYTVSAEYSGDSTHQESHGSTSVEGG
jgi:hypothetical protein